MPMQDRDWWREKYDELHGRKRQRKRPGKQQRSDQGVLKLATIVLLLLVVVFLVLRKAHVF